MPATPTSTRIETSQPAARAVTSASWATAIACPGGDDDNAPCGWARVLRAAKGGRGDDPAWENVGQVDRLLCIERGQTMLA